MELSAFFKSIIDTDRAAVVVCDTEHKIVYMNPAAVSSYAKSGGADLVGKSLMCCHNRASRAIIERVVERFEQDGKCDLVYTYHNTKENKDVYMVALRDDSGGLIGYYEKHEYRNAETMKILDIT